MELKVFALKSRFTDSFLTTGWGNGYVALPKEHPFFGLDYEEINSKGIDVHYGLTFSSAYEDIKDFVSEEYKDTWIVGFDTAHAGDSLAEWPDEQSVLAEAERLKIQLLNFV